MIVVAGACAGVVVVGFRALTVHGDDGIVVAAAVVVGELAGMSDLVDSGGLVLFVSVLEMLVANSSDTDTIIRYSISRLR